jgi:ABC-type multidrug transport system fused ATPase/permease subunit
MAERTTDTLGNIALVQSFARIEAEVSALKHVVSQLLGAQMPVLTWWAALTVLTRTATTVAILAIITLGTWLHLQGLASIGEIVTFMAIATMVIQRLEFAVGFVNRVFVDAPRLADFFEVLDTTSALHERPHATDPGRLYGLVEFKDVSFSYDGKRPAVIDLNFTALPGQTIALVG